MLRHRRSSRATLHRSALYTPPSPEWPSPRDPNWARCESAVATPARATRTPHIKLVWSTHGLQRITTTLEETA